MNFNQKARKIINENITPVVTKEGKRGRAGNPEIEKLIAQGIPYWKARQMVKAGGGAPVADTSGNTPSASAPSGEFKGNAKTQIAVDDFCNNNPECTVEEVISHLEELNDSPVPLRFKYNVDPVAVAKMVDIAKSQSSSGEEGSDVEPSIIDGGEEKDEVDKLTDLFMKLYAMPKDKRKDYMKKLKDAEAEKNVEKGIESDEESDEEDDSYVSDYVKSMKKDEEDEEFDEPKEP